MLYLSVICDDFPTIYLVKFQKLQLIKNYLEKCMKKIENWFIKRTQNLSKNKNILSVFLNPTNYIVESRQKRHEKDFLFLSFRFSAKISLPERRVFHFIL